MVKNNRKLSLSYLELRVHIGLTLYTVESARQNPSLNYIELLERKTKINLYWFLLGRGEMFGSGDPSDGANKVEMGKLNDTIEEQRLLIKMLKEENAKGFSH